MKKTEVYDGYEEKYLTGTALKNMFADAYIADGKHHMEIKNLSVVDYLEFIGIKDDEEYRIFVNDLFCRIMRNDDDKLVCFFGHNNLEHVKLIKNPSDFIIEKICPECGSNMKYKDGPYGPFLGCSGYPKCKHICKIVTIGRSF